MRSDYQSDYRVQFIWQKATVSVLSRKILKFNISHGNPTDREICFS